MQNVPDVGGAGPKIAGLVESLRVLRAGLDSLQVQLDAALALAESELRLATASLPADSISTINEQAPPATSVDQEREPECMPDDVSNSVLDIAPAILDGPTESEITQDVETVASATEAAAQAPCEAVPAGDLVPEITIEQEEHGSHAMVTDVALCSPQEAVASETLLSPEVAQAKDAEATAGSSDASKAPLHASIDVDAPRAPDEVPLFAVETPETAPRSGATIITTAADTVSTGISGQSDVIVLKPQSRRAVRYFAAFLAAFMLLAAGLARNTPVNGARLVGLAHTILFR